MFYILINILSMIFSVMIMASKNRSKFVGFLLGFFFSIFGLVICACLPTKYIEKEEEND